MDVSHNDEIASMRQEMGRRLDTIEIIKRDTWISVLADFILLFLFDIPICIFSRTMSIIWVDLGTYFLLTFPVILAVWRGRIRVLKFSYSSVVLAIVIHTGIAVIRFIVLISGNGTILDFVAVCVICFHVGIHFFIKWVCLKTLIECATVREHAYKIVKLIRPVKLKDI